MPSSVLGSVASSVVGGLIGGGSGDDALDAQMAAANKAAETQKYMYDTSREDLAPFRDTGVAANRLLSTMMGLGEFDRDAIRADIKSKYSSLFGSEEAAAPSANAVQVGRQSLSGGLPSNSPFLTTTQAKQAQMLDAGLYSDEDLAAMGEYKLAQQKAGGVGPSGMDKVNASQPDLLNKYLTARNVNPLIEAYRRKGML